MRKLITSITLTVLLVIMDPVAIQSQDDVIDLGTDTVLYDKEYEYLAAFEMEKYMESFIFYRSAMESYQRDDLFGAKASVSKAIKLNKREVKFKLLKAWILSKEKSYKRAIKYTTKILAENPQNKEAYYCQALNQFLINDLHAANISYSRLIRMNDLDVRAHFGRAEVKSELEDYTGAIADYNAALSIKPTMVLAYEGRGMAYFKIFDFRSAIKDLNQYLIAVPESGKGYYYRALAHLRLNEFSEACKSFEAANKYKYKEAEEYVSRYCNY